MNQQPDKFFRDRLYAYERPLPTHVWDRISEARSKEKQNFVWPGIAAAISLVTVAAVLSLLPGAAGDENLAGRHNVVDSTVSRVPEAANDQNMPLKATPEAGMAPIARQNKFGETPVPKKANKNPDNNKSGKKVSKDTYARKLPEVPAERNAPLSEIPDSENPKPAAKSPTELNGAGRKTVTIVFSAEDVNKKYLTERNVAEATPRQKETSALKKLLDKADDLRHNQNPLGDLRQKKNEILALNLKGDKRRNEN